MTWKRIAHLALAVAVLGVFAYSAGTDWFGSTIITHGTAVEHGHQR